MRAGCFLALLVIASPVFGHFHMLLPDKASARKDGAMSLRLTFGHPFEHQRFDCGEIEKILVLAPDGTETDLTTKAKATQIPGLEGKRIKAYDLPFTPTQRGDYAFAAKMKPVWMEEEGEWVEDTVRAIVHVAAQKGWDESPPLGAVELAPLTRPYGLLPGMAFQAIARRNGKPIENAMVEIERYNPEPPKPPLPPDEFITRTVKTAPNGVATTTLTEPGWWCLTTGVVTGELPHEGKKAAVRSRSTLWVYVNEPTK